MARFEGVKQFFGLLAAPFLLAVAFFCFFLGGAAKREGEEPERVIVTVYTLEDGLEVVER